MRLDRAGDGVSKDKEDRAFNTPLKQLASAMKELRIGKYLPVLVGGPTRVGESLTRH